MWQSNKTHTNRPCVFTLCLYAVPQPGFLPSSYPPPHTHQKKASQSNRRHHCLHPPLSPLFFLQSAGKHKRRQRSRAWVQVPMNVQRLSRGGDEVGRREVKDEEEDLRRGIGVVVIQRTRFGALCHWASASWDKERHPTLSRFLIFSPLLMFSMRALYEPEEGYEVPFGCHWHVKRVWRWQLTGSVACNYLRLDSHPSMSNTHTCKNVGVSTYKDVKARLKMMNRTKRQRLVCP